MHINPCCLCVKAHALSGSNYPEFLLPSVCVDEDIIPSDALADPPTVMQGLMTRARI